MKITKHIREHAAVEDGVWVAPDMDHPEFEVRAKVRSQAFSRKNEKQQAAWARIYGNKGAPPEMQQKFQAKLLFEDCIVDLRGLTDNDGVEMKREDAEQIAGSFEGQPFYILLLTAVNMAEARREADANDAEGNSATPSRGS